MNERIWLQPTHNNTYAVGFGLDCMHQKEKLKRT
jgi:hypothetical protein